MAETNKKGQISGAIGPIVYRVLDGKNIVQTRPVGLKQTQETVASGKEFGTASRLSKAIRKALVPIVFAFNDSRMYSRFTSVLYQTIVSNKTLPKGVRTLLDGDVSLISGFQCNIESPFPEYCTLIPEIQIDDLRVLTVSAAGFKISEAFPITSGATEIALCFLVSCIDPDNGNEIHSGFFKTNIPLSNRNEIIPPQQWQTEILPQNCLVFVTTALIFYQSGKHIDKVTLNNKQLHPCEITTVLKT